MKAIVQTAYGGPDEVLELREITEPTARSGEVLVKVHAASVHPDVWHVVRGVPSVLRLMGAGVREPKVLVPGTDLAGRVESDAPAAVEALCFDPQTSGGLLAAIAADAATRVEAAGFTVIGHVVSGPAGVSLRG